MTDQRGTATARSGPYATALSLRLTMCQSYISFRSITILLLFQWRGELCYRFEKSGDCRGLKHKFTVVRRLGISLLFRAAAALYRLLICLARTKTADTLCFIFTTWLRTLTETLSHLSLSGLFPVGRASTTVIRKLPPLWTQFITRIRWIEGPGHYGHSKSVMGNDFIRMWAAAIEWIENNH